MLILLFKVILHVILNLMMLKFCILHNVMEKVNLIHFIIWWLILINQKEHLLLIMPFLKLISLSNGIFILRMNVLIILVLLLPRFLKIIIEFKLIMFSNKIIIMLVRLILFWQRMLLGICFLLVNLFLLLKMCFL